MPAPNQKKNTAPLAEGTRWDSPGPPTELGSTPGLGRGLGAAWEGGRGSWAPAAWTAICPAQSGWELRPPPRGARAQGRGPRPAEQAGGHAPGSHAQMRAGGRALLRPALLRPPSGNGPLLKRQQTPRLCEALRGWRHVTAPHAWATNGHRAQAGHNPRPSGSAQAGRVAISGDGGRALLMLKRGGARPVTGWDLGRDTRCLLAPSALARGRSQGPES